MDGGGESVRDDFPVPPVPLRDIGTQQITSFSSSSPLKMSLTEVFVEHDGFYPWCHLHAN